MKKLKIVLIDDDHGPMDMFVQALREREFEVEHIDRTEKAVAFAKDTEGDAPALIVVDFMMPYGTLGPEKTEFGMKTGVEIIKLIRANDRLKRVQIVCLSNYDNQEEAARMIGAGIPFVGKYETVPFEFADAIQSMECIRNLRK